MREEYRVYFDRNATQSAAKRRGSGGMHRRSNAAGVSPQAVKTRVGAAEDSGATGEGSELAGEIKGDGLPAQRPVAKPTRPSSPGGGSPGDASRLNHSASLRSALRFGRNTPGPVLPVGPPPSRALSAGRLAPTGRTGRPRRPRGFHHRLLTDASGFRGIPPLPIRSVTREASPGPPLKGRRRRTPQTPPPLRLPRHHAPPRSGTH